MPIFVIAAYHSEYDGKPTDSVDYQLRYFESNDAGDVVSRLRAEKPQTYKNIYGQDVTWIFDDTIALEVNPSMKDGDEVIGFMTNRPHIPEFGERDVNVDYVLRPGGYAIIMTDDRMVAVVSTPTGLYLPGGGQDEGESSRDAAAREAAEECGLQITVGQWIDEADEFVFAVEYGRHFRKRCRFFLASVIGQTKAIEDDHKLVWMSPSDAIKQLKHGSQRWALQQAVLFLKQEGQT